MHQKSHPSSAPGIVGRRFVAGATLALLTGTAWAVQPSSFAESRGYQTCVDGAEREVQLIQVSGDYFIYDHSDARRYYLNGYAFRDGESAEVKIACDTTLSGNRLLGVTVDSGRYAGQVVETVDVADSSITQ